MAKWLNTVVCILSYTLNALLLIGLLYVAANVVDDARSLRSDDNTAIYTYVEERVIENTYTL